MVAHVGPISRFNQKGYMLLAVPFFSPLPNRLRCFMDSQYKPQYPTFDEVCSMDAQQMFDKAAAHMLFQSRKSYIAGPSTPDSGPTPVCAYRGYGNTACGVGFLVPEEVAEILGRGIDSPLAWECFAIRSLVKILGESKNEKLRIIDRIFRREYPLLLALQTIHDKVPVACWCQDLHELAERHELNTHALEAAGRAMELTRNIQVAPNPIKLATTAQHDTVSA
jgi:hypothetical protein